MRKLALTISAVLVLAVVSPAFAQPFADVPTDHWAFDAIAELAAKGVIEGYPDGTFKGDRGITRYEVAMIVARILARIEAIKIPAPTAAPRPEVTRADVQTIQRLVNEFRAELAALGVRVTAVEEELAALKQNGDRTAVAGFALFRHESRVGRAGPYTFGLINLTFTGKSGGVTGVVNTLLDPGDDGVFAFGSGTYPTAYVQFDRAYVDWSSFGWGWRLGRQAYTLGPIGLLFRSGSLNQDAGNDEGVDGWKASGSLGPARLEVTSFSHVIGGQDGINALRALYNVRATTALAGWTVGLNYHYDLNNATAPQTTSNGYSVDLSGALLPGVTLAAEYANWTASGAAAVTAYQANATVQLGSIMGMGANPTLVVQYKNFPLGYTPEYRGSVDLFGRSFTTNFNAWNAQLNLTLSPQFRPYVNWESGTAAGVAYTQREVGFRSDIGSGVTARVRWQVQEGSGAMERYRLELSTSW